MLRDIVEKISTEFIEEAVASPKLLADMAAMEKYMAESYSGRVFIELLQNADDCNSSRIYIKESGGNIIFANDGRPFDQNDVVAISRSGSSNKKRGETIGYRGIGFKSTTYLTDEILIYSDRTYFTFSKKSCAELISMSENNIPMIRIPLLVEVVEEDIEHEVQILSKQGYTTVFVFRNARINEFLEEVKQIESGMFIFLNSISECYVDMGEVTKTIVLSRRFDAEGQYVEFTGNENNTWYIVKHNATAVAFKYDKDGNRIIPCDESEQVYHSFLPSFDKFIYPMKVNADFSTDPSRKHISLDDKTKEAISSIAENIVSIISKVLNDRYLVDFGEIFSMLSELGDFSRCNSLVKHFLKERLLNKTQLFLRDGRAISVYEYKVLPDWLDESEKIYLRMKSEYIGKESLGRAVYETYDDVDKFIKNYTNQQFTNDDIIAMMGETALIRIMPHEMQGKILGRIIRFSKFGSMTEERTKNLGKINLSTESGIKQIKDLDSNDIVPRAIRESLNSIVSKTDVAWFSEKMAIGAKILSEQVEYPKVEKNQSTKKEIKPRIAKWRSAEQQCLEIEKFFGNTVVDVSKKNIGYDVESTTPEGEKRYIEVKVVAQDGSFSITNNEYTTAHQYGERYYLCLLNQNAQNVQVVYIRDPIKSLSFEKRIKQWEWFCEDYNGETYIFQI